MQPKISSLSGNHLLAALPRVVHERLRPYLEPVEMLRGDMVFAADGKNEHVYFPLTSRISLAHLRADGRFVEISLVGNEGVIGIPLLLVGMIVPRRAMVHTAGSAYRLCASVLQRELNRGGPFLCNVVHYAGRLMAQMEHSDHCDSHGLDDQTFCAQCIHDAACPKRERPLAMAITDGAVAPANLGPHWQGAAGNDETNTANTHGVHASWWASLRSWPSRMGSRRQQMVPPDVAADRPDVVSLQLIGCAFTYAREAILITDADCRVIEANDSSARITGYARSDLIGKDMRSLQSGKQNSLVYEAAWISVARHGYWTGEMWGQRANGEHYPKMMTISAVRTDGDAPQRYVAIFSDITETVAKRSQLEFVAHHDALTGLANRSLFSDRLQHAIAQWERRPHSLTVAYLDLDGFKAINDEYGHDVGDALLVTVAQHMQAVVREGDTLARIGGDEFGALLIDVDDMHDWCPIVERLLAAAAEPVTVGTFQMCISASIGVAMFPRDGTDGASLLLHADQAMYLAKQAGKNQYWVFGAGVAPRPAPWPCLSAAGDTSAASCSQ